MHKVMGFAFVDQEKSRKKNNRENWVSIYSEQIVINAVRDVEK